MHELLEDAVQYAMTSNTPTIAIEMTVGDLLHLFSSDQRDAYPVVSDERLVGIVSTSDALRAFASNDTPLRYDDVMETTVESIMTRHVMTVEPATSLRHALQLMGAYRFKNLPVVDRKNHFEGMISRSDIVRVLAQRARCDTLPLNGRPSAIRLA
jgi:CBS domain-containing protein